MKSRGVQRSKIGTTERREKPPCKVHPRSWGALEERDRLRVTVGMRGIPERGVARHPIPSVHRDRTRMLVTCPPEPEPVRRSSHGAKQSHEDVTLQQDLDFWLMGGYNHLTSRRVHEPQAQSQGQLHSSSECHFPRACPRGAGVFLTRMTQGEGEFLTSLTHPCRGHRRHLRA
jgi:hypothetical protein